MRRFGVDSEVLVWIVMYGRSFDLWLPKLHIKDIHSAIFLRNSMYSQQVPSSNPDSMCRYKILYIPYMSYCQYFLHG